jgi:hypothetical protein
VKVICRLQLEAAGSEVPRQLPVTE